MAQWHPILDAVEIEPGCWHLCDQWGAPYAVVRLLTVGGESGYRATTWTEDPADRKLIGYWTTLMAATKGAHVEWIRTRSGPDFAGYPDHRAQFT